MTQNTDVIVIGGGYAGVMAANRLTQRAGVTVTLINPRPSFVERIRLHQLAAGTDDAVVDYREVLAEPVRLTVDSVTHIDATTRTVTLASGDTHGYDYLIYAVGSTSAHVPGTTAFTYPIATFEEAQHLRTALDRTPANAPVTVVGAGPTGIETAAELAEAGRTGTLICGGILGPYLHPRGRRSVTDRLTKLGVSILQGPGTKVTTVTRDTVRLADGRTLPSEVTIWSAGFAVPDLATRSGLHTDTLGRLLTDETLTSIDDPHIIAAGDCAAPSDLPFRMSCQAAGPLGAQAADTVLDRITGKQPTTFTLGFAGQCISLGRRTGIFQLADKNDTAKKLHLAGRPGATLKEFICKHTVKQLANEARKPGSHTWTKDDTRRQLLDTKHAETPATAEQPA